MAEHYCTQESTISEITTELKEIKALLEEMKPTYHELNDWGTFWKKGKEAGLGIALFFVTAGAIFGGIYAIKEWIKK